MRYPTLGTENMTRSRKDLERQRPRIRNAIRNAIRLQSGKAVVKMIGCGYSKDWIADVFHELLDGEPIVWDYDGSSGELWVKQLDV